MPLGRGGMGSVFAATHESMPKVERAVKIVQPPKECLEEMAARWAVECEISDRLLRLNHPNIVPAYEWGREGDAFYIVMELVKGRTVLELMNDRALSVPDALCIARDVAQALETVHPMGIVHRDLKPANILIDPQKAREIGLPGQKVARVLDWGIGKLRYESYSITQRFDEVAVGTAAYMPPEEIDKIIADEGFDATDTGDVYSLGKILYELAGAAKGRHSAPTVQGRMGTYDMLRAYRKWVPQHLKNAPDEVNRLIREMTLRDPKCRPSAREVRAELDRVLYGLDAGAQTRKILIAPQQFSMDSLLLDVQNEQMGDADFKLRYGLFILAPEEEYGQMMRAAKVSGLSGVKVYASPGKTEWVVGRGEKADIRFANQSSVSRVHAGVRTLFLDGEYRFALRDYSSQNGTVLQWLDREERAMLSPEKWYELRHPSAVQFGQLRMVFALPAQVRRDFRNSPGKTQAYRLDSKTPKTQWKEFDAG